MEQEGHCLNSITQLMEAKRYEKKFCNFKFFNVSTASLSLPTSISFPSTSHSLPCSLHSLLLSLTLFPLSPPYPHPLPPLSIPFFINSLPLPPFSLYHLPPSLPSFLSMPSLPCPSLPPFFPLYPLPPFFPLYPLPPSPSPLPPPTLFPLPPAFTEVTFLCV